MESQIAGLFTCDECGASVSGEGTDQHLEWHDGVNRAFEGMVTIVKDLYSKIGQLSPPE